MNNKYHNLTLNLLIASLIISYTIYVRLLVIRLPKNLFFILDMAVNFRVLLLCLSSIIFCLYNVIRIIRSKPTTQNIFSAFILKCNTLIENALRDAFNAVMNCIHDPYNKAFFVAQKFYIRFSPYTEALFPLIIYVIRIIIVSAFLIDVFVFFTLNYMYKALYLLLIIMGIKILFYILKEFSSNLEDIKSYLVITNKGLDLTTGLPVTTFKPSDGNEDIDLKYYISHYLICLKITGYLEAYDRYTNFFTPYISMLVYSLYLIGWFYVLGINCQELLQ